MLQPRVLLILMAVVIGLGSSLEAEAGLFDRLRKRRCGKKARTCQPAPCRPKTCQPCAEPSCPTPVPKRCMQNPALPPGTDPCLCEQRRQENLRCCECAHAGNPTLIAKCKAAAEFRYNFCMGTHMPIPSSFECDCSDCDNYGCDPDDADCWYECDPECVDDCYDPGDPDDDDGDGEVEVEVEVEVTEAGGVGL